MAVLRHFRGYVIVAISAWFCRTPSSLSVNISVSSKYGRKFIYQFNSTFQRFPQPFNFPFSDRGGGRVQIFILSVAAPSSQNAKNGIPEAIRIPGIPQTLWFQDFFIGKIKKVLSRLYHRLRTFVKSAGDFDTIAPPMRQGVQIFLLIGAKYQGGCISRWGWFNSCLGEMKFIFLFTFTENSFCCILIKMS